MLKIRLRRMGTRHAPFYRVVVSDSRRPPKGRAVEELGYYDPRANPPKLEIDGERTGYWVGQGAQMSSSVRRLLNSA